MRFSRVRDPARFLGLLAILGQLFLSVPALEAEAQGVIHFSRDLELSRELAQSTDRPIVVVFGSDSSLKCRRMKERLLKSPGLKFWAQKALWVELDLESGHFPVHEFRIQTVPTVLVEDSSGQEMQRIVGNVDPARLSGLLKAATQHSSGTSPNPKEEKSSSATRSNHAAGKAGPDDFSNVGYGPLRLRSQSGFQSLRLMMMPRSPSKLQKGEWKAFGSLVWSNLWAVEENSFHPAEGELGPYVIDAETLEGNLALSYGISDNFELEFGYEIRSHFGGILDGVIEGFHDLAGIGQQGRDLWPRDQFHFIWAPEGEVEASLGPGDSGIFVQNLLLTIQHNISDGSEKWPAVAWWATVRVGLQSTAFRGRPVDGMLGLALAKRVGDFNAYLSLSEAWYNKDRALGVLDLETTQHSAMGSFEWRYHPKTSLILQYLLSEGVVKHVSPFNQTSKEIIIGMKHELSSSSILEWGIIENLAPFENSPDIGFHFGFTRRY